MKLEVGMYVRTKRDGIGKIISLSIGEEDECCFIELSKRRTGIKEHNIVKEPSHNIIDLIEVGDIVEVEFDNDNGMNKFEVVGVAVETNEIGIFKDDYSIYGVDIKNIKSIVTKEQFEAMAYKVV